jgi:hypothetical protein
MKFTIDLDWEMVDKIVVKQLMSTRQCFLEDLGTKANVFFWDKPEEDDAEIQKHIDAIDLLLTWYATDEQLKEIYGAEVSG